jgi:hypothetical protein
MQLVHQGSFACNLRLALYTALLYCNLSSWDIYLKQSLQPQLGSSRSSSANNLKGMNVFIHSQSRQSTRLCLRNHLVGGGFPTGDCRYFRRQAIRADNSREWRGKHTDDFRKQGLNFLMSLFQVIAKSTWIKCYCLFFQKFAITLLLI